MAQAASKTCEVCVSAPGSHYCIDCEEHYCENCKFVHNRQKLSRNHQFQKASDRIPEGKSRCSEHKEELSLICNTCNAQICTRCVTGKHNGHTFSQIVDVIVQLRGDNETKLRGKTNEANQNIKKIEDSLNVFDNSVESVIKAINDEGNMIKRMVDKSVAQMIALVKEQSKKEKDKLMNMLSDAKSVLVGGHSLDIKRHELDKTRQDGSLVQKINNLKEEIDKLTINSLPEFPNISFSRKAVAEDDIRQLIGTFTIRTRVGMIAHVTNLNKKSNDTAKGHCMVCNKEQNPRHIVRYKRSKHDKIGVYKQSVNMVKQSKNS